jgi:hypothetical protein
MLRPGPPPKCTCGDCRACKMRAIRHGYYDRNRDQIIPKNVETKRRRRPVPEVSDAELDRRALVMMGRNV